MSAPPASALRAWRTRPRSLGIHPAAVPIPSIPMGVSIQETSRNSKLGPTKLVDRGRPRLEPVAVGPFISSTHASITATCPSGCAFRNNGCYAQNAATGAAVRRLDEMGGATHRLRIADQEAQLVDGAFGGGEIPRDGGRDGRSGRDLRLRVAGDYTTDAEAQVLAYAAERWEDRGGGGVFGFTHGWRDIDRRSFGPIRILASVERPEDIADAHARGYDVAIVLAAFAGERAFELSGTGVKVVPCPQLTRGTTCTKCRMCIAAPLRERALVIGFAAHGARAERVRRRLAVVAG
jgi:hypothetical protein